MSRTLRWQIVVPRLLLMVVLLLAAQYALGRLARRAADDWLEAAVDKRTELGHARVSLIQRKLDLHDLRVPTSRGSVRSLLEIDRCELRFAVAPLLYKQVVFERGELSGMRFNASLVASGARRARPYGDAGSSTRWLDNNAADLARTWLERLDECFEQDIPSQFASLQQAKQLSAHWPGHAREFDQRVADLKLRAAELQQAVDAAEFNPLRHVLFLDRLPEEVAELRAEFARAHAELEQLGSTFEVRRRAIIHTRRQDEEQLKRELQLEPMDANLLSAYLLREQVAAQLNEVIAVLRWARDIVPAEQRPLRGNGRGENVTFAGVRPAPSLLVRNLQVQGTARLGGQTVELRGTLCDVTNAPALHPDPIRVRLEATGSLPLELQATLDRTGPVARDELLVDCRGIVMPPQSLGRVEDGFQLALAPSTATLSISVQVEGDKLSGDIQLVQRQVQITPLLTGQLSDVPLVAALEATLADLNALALRVSLSGTLSEPTCTLWSNLGTAVSEAVDRAMRRAGDEHAQLLVTRARRQIDERLTGLEQQIQAQRNELAAETTAATGELERVAAQQLPAPRLSPERLGRRLPEGSLFR